MYLIYQAFRNDLTGTESHKEFTLNELMVSLQPFCHREPVGSLFLEAVMEERLEDGAPILNGQKDN
jgi:hypothetical protein